MVVGGLGWVGLGVPACGGVTLWFSLAVPSADATLSAHTPNICAPLPISFHVTDMSRPSSKVGGRPGSNDGRKFYL